MSLALHGAGPRGEQKSQGFPASQSSVYLNKCTCAQTEGFARSVGFSGAGGGEGGNGFDFSPGLL